MARYTRDSVERVREAVDFVELVGARTELRKSGVRSYSGLCPFHDERTPSFGIDPLDKLFYCFGCGEGGDLFKFVQQTETLDFPGAVEALAERYGVELEREAEDPKDAAKRVRRERLLGLLERTAAWHVRVLWESNEAAGAREYLEQRGLGEDVLRAYRVGYAPSAWDRVLVASRSAGYSDEELHAAGLVQRNSEGRVYDRFRARIMFPLCDVRGQVLGFGARASRDGQQPKYLNSPESEVFHKGGMVYGADLARTAAAKAASVVLCEGYTDVLALSQAGIANAVCSMGTALTEDQARKLLGLAPNVTLCLDADTAGQEAALKAYVPLAAAFARGGHHDLRVAALPAGSDPADVVAREGADAMRALLDSAVPFARFQVERALDRAGGDATARDRVLEEVSAVVRALPEGILRAELVDLVAGRLNMTAAVVNAAVPAGVAATAGVGAAQAGFGGPRGPGAGPGRGGRGKFVERGGRSRWQPDPFYDPTGLQHGIGPADDNSARAKLERDEQAERTFLAYCVAMHEEGERRLADADLDAMFASPAARRAAAYLRGRLAHPSGDLPSHDEALARIVAELVIRAGELEVSSENFALEALQLDLARIERAITAAREAADAERVRELSTEHARVHDAIRHSLQ